MNESSSQAELEKPDSLWRSELLCTPFAMSNPSMEPLQTRYMKTLLSVWRSSASEDRPAWPPFLERKVSEALSAYALRECLRRQEGQVASCTECGKVVDKYRMKQHMQTHNFACQECKLSFKNPFQVSVLNIRVNGAVLAFETKDGGFKSLLLQR